MNGKSKRFIRGVTLANNINALKPKAFPRRERGKTELVQSHLAKFIERNNAYGRYFFSRMRSEKQGGQQIPALS